mmetsp:Transcript_31706/g.58427  ORF Transcript_31706/g.58427 Transcript_31706/m.58427 type:complete len:89 (+) Transcript_31706:202-468(+)
MYSAMILIPRFALFFQPRAPPGSAIAINMFFSDSSSSDREVQWHIEDINHDHDPIQDDACAVASQTPTLLPQMVFSMTFHPCPPPQRR